MLGYNAPRAYARNSLIIILALCLAILACNLAGTTPPSIAPAVLTQVAGTLTSPSTVSPAGTPPGESSPGTFPSVSRTPIESTSPTQELVTSLPPPTFAYKPAFEPTACAFPIPIGTSPECGYLIVPENRTRHDSHSIRLHVAIFHSRAIQPAPDPVVHLAGGPGSSSLDVAGYLFRQGLGAILERRDLILFDQRGTGFSLPRLDCPERQALVPVLLGGNLPTNQSVEAIVDAFQRCRQRLIEEGIDLSAYHSAASAADVDDLRRALGYERLNLYGISYGTRLALTVMRDFPESVRSAVLDSAYPPQVHLYTSLAPNAARAFAFLFRRCAADPDCIAGSPELESAFYSLVDELNANPVIVNLSVNGSEREVHLDGRLLIDVLFVGLYNPAVSATMPRMIFDIRQGNTAILRQRLELYFDASTALGMQMAVQCAEEIPFGTLEEAVAAARETPPQIAAFFPASVAPLFQVCQEWGLPPPEPSENLPVASHIPALVLAGEGDPITPPEWGRLAAATLPNAFFFEFPGQGHWVTRSSPCALQMALAFWDDPATAPDAGCLR